MTLQVKAALWFTVCSVFQKIISFVTIPIFTRVLTTEEYGVYSLYLSWLQLLSIITSLYLYYGIFNNAMIKFADRRDEYISSMQGLVVTITTVFLATVFILPATWERMIGLSTSIIVMMFFELYVTPAFQFWSGKKRFDYKYKELVGVTLTLSLLNPIIGLLFVLYAEDKGTARIFAAVLADIIICGLLWFLQFKRGKRFFVKEFWLYGLSLAIPLLPHYLSSVILNQGDRIMIDHMVGKSEVAFYSIAYSIGMMAQIFTNAILSSFTPWLYVKIKDKKDAEIRNIINILLLVVGLIIICIMMTGPELISIFGSPVYEDAKYVIPPVVASVFFIFLYNLLATFQFYYETTHFLMIASVFAALINIGLNYVFIQRFGYYAAGYTTLICYILYSFGHYKVSSRVINLKNDNGKYFDIKTILWLSAILIMMCIVSNFLFKSLIVRTLIFLVVAMTGFLKRKYLYNILRGLKNKGEQDAL